MCVVRRANAIDGFMSRPDCRIFLLSLRSAACGLHLTAANHVFLLEPISSTTVERQAIGRVWRTGQQRMVTVHQWVVGGTIEERLYVVHHRRESDGVHGRLKLEDYKYLLGEWSTA